MIVRREYAPNKELRTDYLNDDHNDYLEKRANKNNLCCTSSANLHAI